MRNSKRRSIFIGYGNQEYRRLMSLWLCRLALCDDALATPMAVDDAESAAIRAFIELRPVRGEVDRGALKDALRKRISTLASNATLQDTVLGKNVAALANVLELSEIESDIMIFVALLASDAQFQDWIGKVRHCALEIATKVLAAIFACDIREVRGALHGRAALVEMRLVQLNPDFVDMSTKLMAKDGLAEVLLSEHDSVDTLLRHFFRQAEETMLDASDYAHVEQEVSLLSAYLKTACAEKRAGVNVLIHGPPGTGKTELAKVIARQLEKRLFQVGDADDEDQAATAVERLSSYQLCQRCLSRSNDGIVMFDEIEDVFPSDDSSWIFMRPAERPRIGKAWMNRLLETCPVPTIWIANLVYHIEPAYRRRFDFVLQLPIPPKAVRRKIVERYCEGLSITPGLQEYLAEQATLSPAQVERAARVARSVCAQGWEADTALEIAVKSSMAALENEMVGRRVNLHADYRLEYLNTDCNLHELTDALIGSRMGASICLMGPSGSGKTQFAHHLADRSGRTLLTKSASQLLSPWVGGTEKCIASMFDEAERENAYLLLDEAEGFLADRRYANQSWEVTQVNELLMQMERFEGVFICATNLFERMDVASVRRFDFKIKFDYLTMAQSWSLFESQFASTLEKRAVPYREQLAAMFTLTPADFANVTRQAALTKHPLDPEWFIQRLRQEIKLKGAGSGRGMGFIRTG